MYSLAGFVSGSVRNSSNVKSFDGVRTICDRFLKKSDELCSPFYGLQPVGKAPSLTVTAQYPAVANGSFLQESPNLS